MLQRAEGGGGEGEGGGGGGGRGGGGGEGGREGKAMKINEGTTKPNENHKEPQVPLRYSNRWGRGETN